MSEQKVGCVPDGYMPIPTAEQLADALENVRSFHDMSAELIAPRLLANLLASTTVKAELPEPDFALDGGSQPCYYAETVQRIVAALSAQTAPQGLRIVLDGPPGPEAGRFVEVENAAGRSVNAGEWRERADGLWELVLHAAQGGE